MSLNLVTVTWDVEDIAEAGTSGSVQFTLSEMVTDSATGNVISPGPPRTYPFAGVPGSSDALVANDSPTLTPTGSYYNITIGGSTASYTYKAFINYANGATQTLGSLIAQNPQPVQQYAQFLPLPSGTAEAGQVPVATGSGSSTQWGSSGTGGSGYPALPAVSGTPTTGQVLTATSATTADWQTPTGGGGGGAVSSVFGRTGAVAAESGDYTAAEVGALALPSGSSPSAGMVPVATGSGTATSWQTPEGAVASVNGQTGAVTLTASSVGADASGAAAAAEAASLPLPSGTATAGYVAVATGSGNATTWQAQSGGGGTGGNVDGGSATTGTTPVTDLDGGNA